MLIFIVSIILLLYIVLVMYMYNSLKGLPTSKIFSCIIVGIAIMFVLTYILYGNLYNDINIEEKQEQIKNVKMIVINVFTPINGIIILPYLLKNFMKYNQNEINQKAFTKKMLIRLTMFIIFIIFEVIYVKSSMVIKV